MCRRCADADSPARFDAGCLILSGPVVSTHPSALLRAFLIAGSLAALLGLAACQSEPPGPAELPSPPPDTLLADTTAAVPPELTYGIPGTDVPETITTDTGVCYVYARYVVQVDERADVPGNRVRLYERAAGGSPEALCRSTAEADFSLNEDAVFFFGLQDSLLFADAGTAPGSRGLLIYNLARRERVYEGPYAIPIELVDDRYLSYPVEVAAPGRTVPCPDADEWRANGLQVVYQEQVRLDLTTFSVERTGQLSCSPRQ